MVRLYIFELVFTC